MKLAMAEKCSLDLTFSKLGTSLLVFWWGGGAVFSNSLKLVFFSDKVKVFNNLEKQILRK